MSSSLFHDVVVLFYFRKKSSSKDLLQQFADLASERVGGYDVVDGLIMNSERNSNR